MPTPSNNAVYIVVLKLGGILPTTIEGGFKRALKKIGSDNVGWGMERIGGYRDNGFRWGFSGASLFFLLWIPSLTFLHPLPSSLVASAFFSMTSVNGKDTSPSLAHSLRVVWDNFP